MAVLKKKSVTEITGKPIKFDTVVVGDSLTELVIYTDDGVYTVGFSAYSSGLKMHRNLVPERKPVFRVDGKFSDGSTSCRVFTDNKEAVNWLDGLKADRTCKDSKLTEGTVEVDANNEPVYGSTRYPDSTVDAPELEPDIPF